MKVVRYVLSGLFYACFCSSVFSQSLPVGSAIGVEDYYRIAQLKGAADTNVSMTVRPIFPFLLDTNLKKSILFHLYRPIETNDPKLQFGLLPASLLIQENTSNPYGWNDGPMIPAKGTQALYSFGLYLHYGMLTVQVKPELVSAVNSDFSTFNPNQYDVIFARYYDIYNNVDLPVRFGTKPYSKIYWGQSSIRFNYKSFSFGVSSENLWWGPGIYNSLLMSNTAPGFLHLTLNTIKPAKTPIGSFEGQLIAGKLTNSGFPPLEPDHYYFGENLDIPKPDNWRYLAGIVVTWQPKWVPGLFIGYDQASQTYSNQLSGLRDYLPLFSPIKSVTATDQSINAQDQLNSVFMRWIWTPEQFEFYFDWGHYNSAQDITQSLLAPQQSRAYIVGLRKLLPFKRSTAGNILLGFEATQMQGTSLSQDQSGNEWYVSRGIRQGYTNNGQELGAGIGPGGNLQTLEVSWVNGLKKIGIQLSRYEHDNDFYYYAFSDSQNYSEHWVDLTLGLTGRWDYKGFVFNAALTAIRSLNYQWALRQNGDDPNFQNQLTTYNFQVKAGVSYNFR
jgi:hypothetical protein